MNDNPILKITKMNLMAGTRIERAAQDAIEMANKRDCTVTFNFNDIDVVVGKNHTVEQVVAEWEEKMEARSRVYWASPEGQKAKRDAEERANAARKGTVAMAAELGMTMNGGGFKSLEDAIRWLAKYSEVADHVESGSSDYSAVILGYFEKMGHKPNQFANNTGLTSDQWRAQVGRDGELRWLIGQGLDGIRALGSPHPMIQGFAEKYGIDWK